MSQQATQEKMSEMPPQITLFQMMSGYWVSQVIYVAAKLGLADLLKDGPKKTDELAKATETHAPTLYRLLRALSSLGLLTEDADGRFTLTALGAPLQDGPGSVRAMTLHLGEGASWQAWGELLHSVKTGETAFKHVHGMEVFPYYAGHAESNRVFNQAMTDYSEAVGAAVLAAYDFSRVGTIVDIGGGHGSLLALILKANPNSRGILFDIPSAVEGAEGRIGAEGLTKRCELIGGDFFDSVPAGGDVYILKSIIHDWDDERARAILKNIGRAMKPDAKLLLVETVIPERSSEPSFSQLGDLHMLVMTGGRERSAAEFAALFDAAGIKLLNVIPTQSMVSIVEGVKAN
jgi:SAM-dependent methyltransferase